MNDGTIEGAAVELKAHGNIYALAINNKGSIRATGASNRGGSVFLEGVGGRVDHSGDISVTSLDFSGSASALIQAAYAKVDGSISSVNGDGSGGSIQVTGTDFSLVSGELDAAGSHATGGDIVVEGEVVSIGSTASLDASGVTGGGQVQIGGGFQGNDESIRNAVSTTISEGAKISANSQESGNAGTVIVWSDVSTEYRGGISAEALGGSGNGGFVEVSGKEFLTFDGIVSTLSANGRNGTLLLDPTDLTVSNAAASANNVNVGDLTTALGSNNVVISTNPAGVQDGDIRINDNVDYTSANDLTFLAHGNIEMIRRVQNQGDGDVNLVAGWDGATGFSAVTPGSAETGMVDMSLFFDDSNTYGNNGGSVVMTANSQRVSAGSRFGDTNVAAYGVDWLANGWGSTAQFGIYDADGNAAGDAATGNIRVDVHNAITATSPNQNASFGSFQIGHGGVGADTGTGPGDLSGNIVVNTGVDGKGTGDISFVFNTTGNVERFYMQIGHGGRRAHGEHSGDITIDTTAGTSGNLNFEAGTATRNYVMIGHGGENIGNNVAGGGNSTRPLDLSGEITVRTKGDITFKAGEVRGAVPADAWRNTADAFAQLGHGGRNADGSHSGTIIVESGGNLLFESGDQQRNFAQLGHGGGSSDGDHSGDITVDVDGTITFDGRGFGGEPVGNNRNENYVQLGNGGYAARGDHSGTISVTSGDDISFFSGNESPGGISAYRSYAQLGHGGAESDSPNNDTSSPGMSGTITVNSGGDLRFVAGDADEAYVQLGHGGLGTKGQHSDNISVIAVGDMEFIAGQRQAYAQFGHGGYDADGTHSGSLSADVGGNVTFQGGLGDQGRDFRAYAQFGHGGYSAGGAHSGDIYLSADGSISFAAGRLADNYAQLGHGGRGSRSNSNTVGLSGDIDVSAGTGITFTAGTMLERSTSNGFNDGSPYASLPNDANLSNGDEGIYADGRLYAQLGHGGYDADASIGNTYNAGVGHTGDIRVVTTNGDISFSGGSTALGSSGNDEGRFHSAQIGHGGVGSLGDHSGAIEVEATNGSVNFTGGAQTKDGDVNNSTGVIVEDRTDVYNFAAIGHSANFAYWGTPSGNSVGRFSADSVGGTLGLADGINVTAGNAVTFQAGEGRRSYVQLGLGGYESRGLQDGLVDHQGDISVSSGAGGVNFIGGTNTSGTTNAAIANNNSHGRESFAQLGHGGHETDGTFLGDISVTTTNGGNVRFIGGVRADNYVQMGHGGRSADSGGTGVAGGNDGDITVNADGDVQFIAGTLFEPAATGEDGRIYSLLGHGGYESDAFVGGTLVAGSGHTGDITVNAGGIVDVIGGNTAEGSLGGGEGRVHFAQIGHGGYLSAGEHAGSVNVTAGGAVDVLGGRSSDDNGEIWNQARIGHGGRGYTWGADVRAGTLDSTSLSGNTDGVNVRAGGDVRIVGGLDRSQAMIGLGGHEWDGDHSGDVSVVNTSGNILLQAGEREQTPAIIGNGGYAAGGNVDGDITVISAGTLQAIGGAGVSDSWGNTNEGHESYAQIGHGGRESDGNASGDIVVRIAENFELIAGQNGGYRNYVQIGHGGERMNGTQSGLISVKAGSGLSRIVASQGLLTEYGDESYAQIGHGGYAASGGNKSGNIEVIITDGGGLDLVSGDSGSGGNAYAQIGHGGTSMAGTDEVSGNITAIIDGELSLERNEAQTQIAHRGGTLTRQAGGVQSDLTVIAGTIDTNINGTDDLFVINDQTANSQVRNVWLMPYLSNDIGDVTFGTSGSGSLHVAQDINYNSTSNLTFVSGTNFHSTERILNEDNGSTGNVNIVAGWDGTTGRHTLDFTDTVDFEIVEGDFDIAPIQADGIANGSAATSFGNNNGVAVIGRAPDGTRQGDWTAVGSAQGETNVFGRDVLVAAGRQDPANDWSGAAQIGMRAYTTNYDITGDIHVQATRDVSILAGDQVAGPDNPGAREAFAMIGHGGVNQNARARDEISGTIYVDAGRNVTATAGTNRRAFVQIGHGGVTGYNAAEELQRIGGDIDVLARSGNIAFTGGTGLEAFAHLGHGGRDLDPVANVAGGISSDIVARAGGDISFVAGTGGLNGANDSYAQLGHGGAFSDANRGTTNGWFGDIQVEAGADGSGFTQTGGEIDVVGGSEHRNYAQIGHGGRSVKGSHQGHMEVRTSNGAIDVVAGTGLDSGDTQNFAQIGHGGYDSDGDLSGDIAVHATNGVTLDASQGTQQHGFVQIGHGGYASSGTHSGFVTVTNTDSGDITLAGGSGANDQAAQIGHGGGSNGNFDLSGSISVVNLGGGVSLSSGDGSWRGAIIGHGDAHDAQTGGARTGGLNVYANGAVTLADGGGNSGAYISHQTNAGIGSVSYAGSGIQANGDSGYSVVSTGGITFSAKQLSGPGNAISLSETIGSALAQGDIALASGGATSDLDLGAIDTTGAIATALSSYNSSNDVVFAAGRNLTVGFGMQNEGDGDIGLIAGWDSDTIGGLTPPQMDALDAEPHFDPASGLALGRISIPDFGVAIPLPANCAEFGNNGGDIVLGNSGQATPVRIGSREGTTSVLGDSVT
ncbi:MAG: hypothetical protein MI807_20885, partial [Verrucomicrobiales bacterium]|nr:hypothetical protein [Verrucomicrobiales bacterium]